MIGRAGGTLAAVLIGLVAAELAARAAGERPWIPSRHSLQITPGGELYRDDPTVGYLHRAGRCEVTLPTGLTFHVTHDASGLRVTRPTSEAAVGERPGVWIFGCSFTYGSVIEDRETFPGCCRKGFPGTTW